MAVYRFRLATLLRIREAARDERRAQLAEALRAEQVLSDRQNQLGAELQGLKQRYRSAAEPGSVSIDKLLDAQRYEFVVKAEIEVIREQAHKLTAEVNRRREALVAADREVRVLEKLREKEHEQFKAAEALAAGKMLDELGARRAATEELV